MLNTPLRERSLNLRMRGAVFKYVFKTGKVKP